jgi:electron transport complex protein RnfG
MILTLTLIAMLSGGTLAYWDAFTIDKIAYHRQEALKAAITEVLPAHDRYEVIQRAGIRFCVGQVDGQPVAVAFHAEGSGFQGKLSMMIGVSQDFAKLTGIRVLEQVETPGLGTKIVSDPTRRGNSFWFPQQFAGKRIGSDLLLVKNRRPATDSEVEAITGATISSKAVVRIINQAVSEAGLAYNTPTR